MLANLFNERRWVIRGWSAFNASWIEGGEYRWRWTADVVAWFYNLASGFEEFYRVEQKR